MVELTTSYGPDRSLNTSIPGAPLPNNGAAPMPASSFGGLSPEILQLLLARSRAAQPQTRGYGASAGREPLGRPAYDYRGMGQEYEQPQYQPRAAAEDSRRLIPHYSYAFGSANGGSWAGSAPQLPTFTGNFGREGEDFVIDGAPRPAGGVSHSPQADPRAAQSDDFSPEFQRRLPKKEPK